MRITLEIVRQTLREALGFESFVASFITEVREDPDCPTAGIRKDGRLVYNPRFVAERIGSKEDLFCLIFHELLHPMFGHFIYKSGRIENIAADAVINAVTSMIYARPSGGGGLFKKIHEPRGLSGLMRPESQMSHSRYQKLYEKLYWRHTRNETPISTGELIQALKLLSEREDLECIMLLGSHGDGEEQQGEGLEGLSSEELGRIAQDIKKSVVTTMGQMAGQSDLLVAMLMEALRTHLTMRKALLQRFATKRKIDRFKEAFQVRRVCVSPIPLRPSKRDLVMLAAGQPPFYYHNQVSRVGRRDRGLAIYLDVSGSVNEHLPQILGILRGLRREITSIFQFSNKVVEIPFEALLAGRLDTTFGTDFDCIAESVIERKFEKAIIITDGIASMQEELKEKLKAQGFQALTVLLGDYTTCEDLELFGDVVALKEICE